jgi:hypothetical protein
MVKNHDGRQNEPLPNSDRNASTGSSRTARLFMKSSGDPGIKCDVLLARFEVWFETLKFHNFSIFLPVGSILSCPSLISCYRFLNALS